MKNLWNNRNAKSFSNNDLSMRVYSSRLLGQNPELVLHGGGNTSVKGFFKNIFNEKIKTLFIKGSGWDLISIEKEGFAPVNLNYLINLAKLRKLSDSQMAREQRLATLNSSAPNPSVEAILHALIPFKFVDHTHADAVLSITNTPNGQTMIKDIYENDILIVPYVMPGFILAKKIAELTKNVKWGNLKGMILLNHGVFSFGENAKDSYDRMIDIVSIAENYLKKRNVWKKFAKSKSTPDLLTLANIRKNASIIAGKPYIALLNDSEEAVGFSKQNDVKKWINKGTLTPDHVIRTKPFAWIIEKDLEKSGKRFAKQYDEYFEKYKSKGLTKLDSGPKWALWPNHGTICFGKSKNEAQMISDINLHTIRSMQVAHKLDSWKPIALKKLFEVEYWELEQAKLKKDNNPPEFQGKIAIVTGAASGIGKACAEQLLVEGCAVAGIDKNKKIVEIFGGNNNYKGFICDLTNPLNIKSTIQMVVRQFGGIDILVSNAGVFSATANLENISDKKWERDLNINLTTHHKVLRECIPFLKYGINPAVVFMGSRNVGAPGPGAGTYTVAKTGLTQMARLAALELAKYNIRVNTVHPDCVYDTNVWTEGILISRAKQYGLTVKDYKRRNLLKTDVSSLDVANLVCFLAGRKSSKTTGAQIPIDGGNNRII